MRYANVAATLALGLALTSPVWGDPVADTAASVGKKVNKALKLSKKADKRSKKALKTARKALEKGGPPGPQGLRGATGARGATGPRGSQAASMLLGRVDSTKMPPGGASNYFLPSGDATTLDEEGISPNTTVVLRDLRVEVDGAPGAGNSWVISLGDGSQSIACTIANDAFTCNSGNQTATIQPGSPLSVTIQNVNSAAPTDLQYGYRAVTP